MPPQWFNGVQQKGMLRATSRLFPVLELRTLHFSDGGLGRRGNDPDPATIRIREFYRAWRSVELPCFP